MKRTALFLLLVIANSIGLQAQQLTQKFENKRFSINYPYLWQSAEYAGVAFAALSPLEGPADQLRENINVIVTKNTNKHNLKTYGEATHKQLRIFKNYTRESVSTITTDQGYEVQKIIYGHAQTGSRLKVALYQVIKDSVIFDITCTSTIFKFKRFEPLFDKMAKSFYVKDLDVKTIAHNKFSETIQEKDDSRDPVENSQAKEMPAVTTLPKHTAAPVVNKTKPTLNVVQPKVQRGVKFLWLEKEITIKGTATSPNGVFEVLVNGVEAPLENGSSFSHTLKLAYKDNPVTIKVTDVNGNITEESFVIERQVKVEHVNDTLKRQGQDYALIFVTDNYDNYSHLTNPVNDGETIAKELQNNYGFKTEVVKNAERAHVYEMLREYSKRTYADDDQLMIFFAGHGEYDDIFAEGYIVTKDSKKNDEVKESFIPHSNLRTIINHIPCKHILLVMDVCFGGTFDQALVSARGEEQTDEVDKAKFIQRKLQYTTRRYLTSGGKEYVPDGRPGEHSPFARKCLEALRSNGGQDGVLTFGEFYSYVEKATSGPRTGEFGNNEPGSDFLFIYKR